MKFHLRISAENLPFLWPQNEGQELENEPESRSFARVLLTVTIEASANILPGFAGNLSDERYGIRCLLQGSDKTQTADSRFRGAYNANDPAPSVLEPGGVPFAIALH